MKYFPDKILAIILRLFNSFLETGQIIEDLCKGLIAPIYKDNEKVTPITIGVSVYQMPS